MVNNKLVAVSKETHAYISDQKIIPKEPYGDCLARLLNEHRELKSKEGSQGLGTLHG